MALTLRLPTFEGTLETYRTDAAPIAIPSGGPIHCRRAFAAAHVVSDPFADINPIGDAAIDWDGTLQYRHYLWSLGLAVAEAMDTAQRGAGLNWPTARELIERSVKEAKAVGGKIACGAGTDHLTPTDEIRLEEVVGAYVEQVSFVEKAGGQVILMASRALSKAARSSEDYLHVYGKVLSQVKQPVILHWLGDMFDPQLANYWGVSDANAAMQVCLDLIDEYEKSVEGIKISLLDADKEIEMRRRLPQGVRMYTGDDFNYDQLMLGDAAGYSHALLGIFDAIAPAAAAALRALDGNDIEGYLKILAPTIPLSRHIFKTPTFAYKTGIVFLAYLNGHQDHFKMLGGHESARSTVHLAELFRLADRSGILLDPDLAVRRMKSVMVLAGIEYE